MNHIQSKFDQRIKKNGISFHCNGTFTVCLSSAVASIVTVTPALTHIDFFQHSFDDKIKCERFAVYFLDQLEASISSLLLDKRTNKCTRTIVRKISTQINLNQCHHQTNKQTSTTVNLRTANVIETRQFSCLCYQILDRIKTTFVVTYILSFEMIICCRDIQIQNGNR